MTAPSPKVEQRHVTEAVAIAQGFAKTTGAYISTPDSDHWLSKRLATLERHFLTRSGAALNAYRAAVSYIGEDSWDGCSDCIAILKAARTADLDWDWAGDPNRIAAELAKIRPFIPDNATVRSTPSGDAEGRARELLAETMRQSPGWADLASAIDSGTNYENDKVHVNIALRAITAAITPPPAPTEAAGLREAIRTAKLEAETTYGIAWHNLEEISRFELVLAALAKSPPAAVDIWRHVKRGTIYCEIGRAELQIATRDVVEGSELVIYRDLDGKLWAREYGEFEDGRFERVAASPDTTPKPIGDVREEYMSVTLSRDGVVQSHNAFDANFDEMVEATRTIIETLQTRLDNRLKCPFASGKALRDDAPKPLGDVLTVAAYNDLYDPANEAGHDTFTNGFREGFLFARFPEGYDSADADDAMREVDGVTMGEAWDGYRDEFFRRLPIAAIPNADDIGKPVATSLAAPAVPDREGVNTVLARHFAPFIDDVAERVRVGNLACTEIVALLALKPGSQS